MIKLEEVLSILKGVSCPDDTRDIGLRSVVLWDFNDGERLEIMSRASLAGKKFQSVLHGLEDHSGIFFFFGKVENFQE